MNEKLNNLKTEVKIKLKEIDELTNWINGIELWYNGKWTKDNLGKNVIDNWLVKLQEYLCTTFLI